jgi:hypothetical protein
MNISPTLNDLIENAQKLSFEISRLFNAMTILRDYDKKDFPMPDAVFDTLTDRITENQEALNDLFWHIQGELCDE